jgi:TonB family protein
MASESLTPKPPSGGSAKYIVILLLLLGGGLGVYLATSGEEPKTTAPPEVKSVERPTALSNETVQIPVEEEEDASEPVKEEPTATKRPRASGDVWTCEGDLDPKDIKRVLSQNETAIRSCYERALRNNNQLQGKVELGVRIAADGKVSNTRVQGSLRDPEVSRCIQSLAKQWSFPAPRGGSCARFDQPYTFTPKN